jgi:SSS family solute:Na+ symporter
VYLLGITAFGIWVGFRRDASPTQYFLANRSLSWVTVGAALFTSNISTIHLLGLAAGGAKDGLVIGNFEWMACFILILLALVFTPFYISSGVQTLPQFMERRYCLQARTFMAIVGVLGALLIHIGISLFAAGKIFQSFLGLSPHVTVVALSVLTVAYTALGGLKAVVMTETVQVCLLLTGATLVTVLGLRALPSVGVHDIASFRSALPPAQLHMLQPIFDARGHLNEYSWLATLLGYPILGIWYWCADQTHVQRILGARNTRQAQRGALFAGFLKITPVFLMVFPGVIAYVLWQGGTLQLQNGASTSAPDFNATLPALMNYVVPVGLKGLFAAAMAAALMSCMSAAINSCSTIIAIDVISRHRPRIQNRNVVRIGRLTTIIVMVLAMLWSTQGDQFGTIFEAVNKIPMAFAPAVTTVFVFGLLWRRGTALAAVMTLYIGSIMGVIYFVMDMPSIGRFLIGPAAADANFVGLVTDPNRGLGIPFMLAGPLIGVVCVTIYVITSLLSPAMEHEMIAKVCWDHPLDFLRGRLMGPGDPRLVSSGLIVLLAVLYYIFR